MEIQSITIDSSATCSDLCKFGAVLGVDKSPYNTQRHRHPYTAVYSLLFSRYRYSPVVFAEIGIGTSRSINMWRQFFESPNAHIACFDVDTNLVAFMNTMALSNVHPAYMDVSKPETIATALREVGQPLDVLLDDSSHSLNDQVNIVREAIPYLKSGGLLIIEDVSRAIPNAEYNKALEPLLGAFSYVSFIVTEHALKWSPGWDNDKLLVFIKK